jgi:hypothetical protein
MARYRFESPAGWRRESFPPPQQGVYLRAPVGAPRGAILLFDRLAPDGGLDVQLARVAAEGCRDAEVLESSPALPAPTRMPGLLQVLGVTVGGDPPRREWRTFVLMDAGGERLPAVFLADDDGVAAHRDAFVALLRSVHAAAETGVFSWLNE